MFLEPENYKKEEGNWPLPTYTSNNLLYMIYNICIYNT